MICIAFGNETENKYIEKRIQPGKVIEKALLSCQSIPGAGMNNHRHPIPVITN